jgi:hypothetical protein
MARPAVSVADTVNIGIGLIERMTLCAMGFQVPVIAPTATLGHHVCSVLSVRTWPQMLDIAAWRVVAHEVADDRR